MQTTCRYECAIEYANSQKKKNAEAKQKKARKAVKELGNNHAPTLKKKLQAIVNEYVRLRDRNLPCISCGTMNAKWDAGHYQASTNSKLRFNTVNIRKQCFRCNRMLSGNLRPYRENLIKLIGENRVIELENTKGIHRHDTDYLNRAIKIFRRKIKATKKRHDLI